jgi:inner membrane protein
LDSVTHIVAGAALGELALGKKLGNKALVLGAVANTIPDLDVFFPNLSGLPEAELMLHRGYTHALFTHPFMAIPFAFLTYLVFKKQVSFLRWWLFYMLGFFTHVMMDCCTTYGTQLLLPFTNKLISWNNLSVVDPLYTIPLLLFFLVVWFLRKDNEWRRKLAVISMVLSVAYLATSTCNKFRSVQVFKAEFQRQNISYDVMTTTPTMFTSWLWNVIAYDDSTMYFGEWSVFQKKNEVEFVAVRRNLNLLKPMENSNSVQVANWFAQGHYFVEPAANDTLNYYITKWGRGDITSTETTKMFPFYSKFYYDEQGRYTYSRIEPNFERFGDYFKMIRWRIFEY